MKVKIALLSLLLIAVLSLLIAERQLQAYLDTPMAIPEQGVAYQLKKGSSLSRVAAELSAQQLLSHPRGLKLYCRLSGCGHNIKAGEYWLAAGTTPRRLVEMLERGEVRSFQLTLVEGWTLWQVLAAVRAEPRLRQTIDAAAKSITVADLNIELSHPSLEGLLFPDTYNFQSGSSDVALLKRAYQRMQQVLNEEWQQRSEFLPYNNAYEALTMASIIEKETGVAHERAQIAGVFVRRLQKNMRLQTDPSIIYGLGANFDGNLRRSHLKDASNPYNTYRHFGLTPTPIALAGREAIRAALHPQTGSALYFVAKGDGSHYFSDTLKQHQQAVVKYQIQQRAKQYRSSPNQ